MLLPKNEKNKQLIEKPEIHCFGAVPRELPKIIDSTRYSQSPIRRIVCGNSHCLILFNDGSLYGFGGNEEGQLGVIITDEKSKYLNDLTKINFSLPAIPEFTIEDIAAGDVYSIVLIKARNKFHIVHFGIKQEDKYKLTSEGIKNIWTEKLPDDDEEELNIKSISAFGKRKVFVTQDNTIYISGIDFTSNKLKEYVLFYKFEKQIHSVNMGLNHIIILATDGLIYGLGDNTYGELGILEPNLKEFREIKFDSFAAPVKKVACGARHTLILLSNGILYGLGDNSEGQCSGYSVRNDFPVKIQTDYEEKIIDCYCGYTHNLIVLESGDVLTWGDSSGGKLGYNEEHFSQSNPKAITQLKKKLLNYASLGFQMTIISTGDQESFVGNK